MASCAHVAVVGGGIAGAATFAALATRNEFAVTLIEAAGTIGSATTAMNNGRCHSGASGIWSDPESVTARKLLGSAILREMPIPWQSSDPALYYCSSASDAAVFRARCGERGIQLFEARGRGPAAWIDREFGEHGFQLHEPAFDTVDLADRFVAAGRLAGGKVLLDHPILRITSTLSGMRLHSAGEVIDADLVIDTTSKFAGAIAVDDRPRLVDLSWYRWPIVAVPRESLPALTRVITIMDDTIRVPSAIPHGEWVTIDCKTVPERVSDPVLETVPNPAPMDLRNFQEEVIDRSARAFRAVHEGLRALAGTRVFYGIQGRRTGEEEYSDLCRTYGWHDLDRYMLRQGGLATSCLLDALETAEEAGERLGLQPLVRQDATLRIAEALRGLPMTISSRMIYTLD